MYCLSYKLCFLAEFSTFEWSPDETKLLYIAEKKQQQNEAFYKRKSARDSLVEEVETINVKVVMYFTFKKHFRA